MLGTFLALVIASTPKNSAPSLPPSSSVWEVVSILMSVGSTAAIAFNSKEKQGEQPKLNSQTELAQQLEDIPESSPPGENLVLELEEPVMTMNSLISKGSKFVDTLCNTTLSCIFLGIPGTGKTTILGVSVGRMRRRYGKTFTVEMIAMKGDSLLEDIQPIIFYQEPEFAFDAVYRALKEHRRRASMPKEKRLAYAAENPYRLIIDDFTSQQQKLDGIFKDLQVPYGYGVDEDGSPKDVKLSTAYEDALNELWFNGRETNVGVWLGTHSETIDDLKFVSSKSGRSSGLLCFLGRRDKITNQGHYDIVSGNLKHFIISDKQRLEELKNQFNQAMRLAYERDKPLALISGIDGGSFGFAIIPDLTGEYQSYLPGKIFEVEETSDVGQNSANFTIPQLNASIIEETLERLPNGVLFVEETFEDIECCYTPHNLTSTQLKNLINTLKMAKLKQTQIIKMLWSVEAGGAKNTRWQKARKEYREITGE